MSGEKYSIVLVRDFSGLASAAIETRLVDEILKRASVSVVEIKQFYNTSPDKSNPLYGMKMSTQTETFEGPGIIYYANSDQKLLTLLFNAVNCPPFNLFYFIPENKKAQKNLQGLPVLSALQGIDAYKKSNVHIFAPPSSKKVLESKLTSAVGEGIISSFSFSDICAGGETDFLDAVNTIVKMYLSQTKKI